MDGSSLRFGALVREGKDILVGLGGIWKYLLGPLVPAEMACWTGMYQMHPAEVYRDAALDGRKLAGEGLAVRVRVG